MIMLPTNTPERCLLFLSIFSAIRNKIDNLTIYQKIKGSCNDVSLTLYMFNLVTPKVTRMTYIYS